MFKDPLDDGLGGLIEIYSENWLGISTAVSAMYDRKGDGPSRVERLDDGAEAVLRVILLKGIFCPTAPSLYLSIGILPNASLLVPFPIGPVDVPMVYPDINLSFLTL